MGPGALSAGDEVPVAIVRGDQPAVAVTFVSEANSDPGPYPLPDDAQVSARDRRVVVVDDDACRLYELYDTRSTHPWQAGYGSVFDLRGGPAHRSGWVRSSEGLDPVHDCSGLPVYPGLLRYDELVTDGAIRHALRVNSQRSQRGFVAPAVHGGSVTDDPAFPPMGARLRLKAETDCGGFSAAGTVLCATLKTYGLLLAHNGPTWSLGVQADERWTPALLADLARLQGSAFEVVDTGEVHRYGKNPTDGSAGTPPIAAPAR
jgi:hypothetical protein